MALHPVCFFTSRLKAIWGFLSGNLTHVSSGSPLNVAVAPLASLIFWNILGTPLTQSCPLAQARLNTPRRHRGARTPPVTRVRHRGALTSRSPSVPSPPGAICLPGDVSRDTLIDCHDGWGALLASGGREETRVLLDTLRGADGPRDSAICPDVRGAPWRSEWLRGGAGAWSGSRRLPASRTAPGSCLTGGVTGP